MRQVVAADGQRHGGSVRSRIQQHQRRGLTGSFRFQVGLPALSDRLRREPQLRVRARQGRAQTLAQERFERGEIHQQIIGASAVGDRATIATPSMRIAYRTEDSPSTGRSPQAAGAVLRGLSNISHGIGLATGEAAWLRRAVVAVGKRWQLGREACCVGEAADHVNGPVGAMHPGPLGQPPLTSDASRLRPQPRQSPAASAPGAALDRLCLRAMPLRGRSLPGGRDFRDRQVPRLKARAAQLSAPVRERGLGLKPRLLRLSVLESCNT